MQSSDGRPSAPAERGAAPPAVEARGLTRRFDEKLAVDHLDLRVADGEFYGFLGPNGAGKSTTINMLVGLLRPTEGRCFIRGVDMWTNPLEAKRRLGVLTDESHLYQRLSAREAIQFSGVMYGASRKEAAQRTEDLLEVLDLTDDADKLIIDYSHGMRKKTALAAALVHNPEVLFLDEPFEGIDAVTGRVIRDVLRQLQTRGATIFFTSHILEVVERLCSRVGVIANGRLVAEGTMDELRSQVRKGSDATLEDLFLQAVGASEMASAEGRLAWLGQS